MNILVLDDHDAFRDEVIGITMFTAGVLGYIIKPFDEEGLMRHLSAYAGLPRNVPYGTPT